MAVAPQHPITLPLSPQLAATATFLSEASLRVSIELYGAEAVFQTAYKFTDRCYLFVAPESNGHVVVQFRRKDGTSDLSDIVGQFSNELLDQHLRIAIGLETRSIRERLYSQAFADANFSEQG